MALRFTMVARSIIRFLTVPGIATLATVTALSALMGDGTASQARPAPPTEAAAPREAGEPIMAIVSIKTQQVTFYDADGWIVRAPVSTGTKGRETPAGRSCAEACAERPASECRRRRPCREPRDRAGES
jgi:hypothetical protein